MKKRKAGTVVFNASNAAKCRQMPSSAFGPFVPTTMARGSIYPSICTPGPGQ